MKLEDILHWSKKHGKNAAYCIAVSRQDYYVTTLCGAWRNGSVEERPLPPEKICLSCKKKLRELSPTLSPTSPTRHGEATRSRTKPSANSAPSVANS